MLIHPQFDPIALALGPVQIHWYGLTYLAAFWLFYQLAARRITQPAYAAGGWTRRDMSLRDAWLSAYWGSLPLEGGIEAAYRADIEAAEDPQAELLKIEARLNALRSPFRSAEKFWVEEIIDPRQTRRQLVDFVRLAEPLRTPGHARFAIRP